MKYPKRVLINALLCCRQSLTMYWIQVVRVWASKRDTCPTTTTSEVENTCIGDSRLQNKEAKPCQFSLIEEIMKIKNRNKFTQHCLLEI